MSETFSITCDHCGSSAITSETNEFGEGDADHCETCNFPGFVTFKRDWDKGAGDADPETAYWSCSEDEDAYCNDQSCDDCRVAREKAEADYESGTSESER